MGSISDSSFEWGSEHAGPAPGPEPAIWPHGQEQPEARAEAVLDKGVLFWGPWRCSTWTVSRHTLRILEQSLRGLQQRIINHSMNCWWLLGYLVDTDYVTQHMTKWTGLQVL